MTTKPARKKQEPRMSDEAVKAKTGKVWKEWFSLLDKAGAPKMTHRLFQRSEEESGRGSA